LSAAYRPGQLHEGRDGDLLFVITTGDGIAFMTNRGTRVTVSEAARVHAPLTLVRPVGNEAATPLTDDVRDLAEAVREALDVPRPASGADWDTLLQLQRNRAICVDVTLRQLLKNSLGIAAAARLVRDMAALDPVTYTPREPAGDDRSAGVVAEAMAEIPGEPGYVVGTCGHRLAAQEWRAGCRTCELCPDEQATEDGR
jgi:hypothetical protein